MEHGPDEDEWDFSQNPEGRNIDTAFLIKSVLDRCTSKLVEDMCPQTVLDRFIQDDIISYINARDITELSTTSDKNRAIREVIRRKPDKYVQFKQILIDTQQPYLAEVLEDKESLIYTQMKDMGYRSICSGSDVCEILTDLHIDVGSSTHSQLRENPDINELRDIQRQLVEIYTTHYSHLPINPLTPEVLVPLSSLYVAPAMESVDHFPKLRSLGLVCGQGGKVKSLKEVFLPLQERTPKQIYLKGEAGTGKTAFCKHIITNWCSMIDKIRDGEHLNDDELVVSNFDLVFFITLKDHKAFTHINAMIKQFMKKDISNVLGKWRCLILLDGLDDWTTPNENTSTVWSSQGVPERDFPNRHTILTTTRPWKLADLKLRSTDIDHLIEVCGVDENEQRELLSNLQSVLSKGKNNDKSSIQAFFTALVKSDFESLVNNPAILKMLFCLWHGQREFGTSYTEANINLLERFLEFTSQKYETSTVHQECNEPEMPAIFKKPNCKKYWNLLKAIGHLAFLNVIDRTNEYQIAETDKMLDENSCIRFGVKTGILTQTTQYDSAVERRSNTLFVHKPLQGILIAIHVALSEECVLYNTFEIWNSMDKILEITNVLLLLCGIQSQLCGKITSIIMSILDKDPNLLNYRCSMMTSTIPDCEFIMKLQNLIAKLALESSHNNLKIPNARLYDLAVNRNLKESTLLMNINKRFLKSIHVKTDKLEADDANDETYQNLFDAVQDSQQLQKVHIDDSRKIIDTTSVFGLICQSFNTITCLCIEWINLNELGLKLFKVFDKMYLKSFCLRYVQLTHEQLSHLQTSLNNQTELSELELREIRCSDRLPLKCQYSIVLNEQITLQTLILCGLDVTTVQLSTQKMELLELGCKGMETASKKFLTQLKVQQSSLSELVISECVDTELLVETLPCLTELKTLRVSRTDFGEVSLLLPKRITSIRLDSVTVSRHGTMALLESVRAIDHRVHVEMVKVASVKDLCVISSVLGRCGDEVVILKDTQTNLCFYTNKPEK